MGLRQPGMTTHNPQYFTSTVLSGYFGGSFGSRLNEVIRVKKGLTYGAIEPAAGGTARRRVTMQQGIAIEKAREIVKLVKDSKKKAQASIQGDLVRVSSKDRDTLQETIALLKGHDFGIDLQFTNYRTN